MIHIKYGLLPSLQEMVDPSAPLLFGCEYEIEDLISIPSRIPNIIIETDGSLRNGGKEFISSPLNLENTLETFSTLHSNISYGSKAFSDRTSIHVHVNCMNLELYQVRNIVLLYALFEECFFRMVEPTRRDNIHCVALTETFLPAIYRAPIHSMVCKWHKYTALNLKPLVTQGTIEFRHMHGHNDLVLFESWLHVIEKLFSVGKGFEMSTESLSKEPLHKTFLSLFGHTGFSGDWEYVWASMENQLLDVKLSTI